jgi:hypothetical protein
VNEPLSDLDSYMLATLGPRWDWIETRQVALGLTLLAYGLGNRATLKLLLPLSLNEVNTLRQHPNNWSRTGVHSVRLEGRQVVDGVTLDVRPMEGAPPDSDLAQVIARAKAHVAKLGLGATPDVAPVTSLTPDEGTLDDYRRRFRRV